MSVSFRKFVFRSRSGARFLRDYLEFKINLGYTSYAQTPAYMAQQLDQYLRELALADLAQLDEQAMLNWIYGQPYAPNPVKNTRIRFLRGFCQYLTRRGILHSNPALAIPFHRIQRPKPYIYSLLEIHQILQEAAKYPRPTGPTLRTLFFLLYACGLRLGEALKLRVQDIDFEERTLSLWETKFHKERLVPFSPAVSQALKTYLRYCRQRRTPRQPTDRLFSLLAVKSPKTLVEYFFRVIRRRLGLEVAGQGRAPRLHDLRHTFAVHRLYQWYQQGAHPLNKLPLLSTYMGHVGVEHTQVYLTVTEALLREGDRRFQQSFEAVTHPALRRAFKQS